MSMIFGPICGCPGCREEAVYQIEHAEHGTRVVCKAHAEGHKVRGHV